MTHDEASSREFEEWARNVRVPDYVEAMRAWRIWRVARGPSGAHRLRSLTTAAEWPPDDKLEAACDAGHPAPELGHTCGVYAVIDEAALARWALERGPILGEIAVGEVDLWGKVIKHERGWRAQYAYPHSFFVVCFGWEWPALRRRRAEMAEELTTYPGFTGTLSRDEFMTRYGLA
jgi:hypothetical protein